MHDEILYTGKDGIYGSMFLKGKNPEESSGIFLLII